MVRNFKNVLLVVALLLSPAVLAAADITDHLPDSTLGYVAIRNMESMNSKTEKLFSKFDVPLPTPLFVLKTIGGLDKGLDLKGDILLALLPVEGDVWRPNPMILISVSDFAAFAKSVNGDPSGEISAVQIQGQEMYLAKKGNYALLMDLQNRELMEKLLSANAKPLKSFSTHTAWMKGNDIAISVLPAGIKLLSKKAKTGLNQSMKQMEENMKEFGTEEQIQGMRMNQRFANKILELFDTDVQTLTYGLSLDASENLKLGLRIDVSSESMLAKLGGNPIANTASLSGIPAGPFVFAGSGPYPKEWTALGSKAFIDFIISNPEIAKTAYGVEELTEEDKKFLESLMKDAYQNVTAMSLCMRPGKDDQPIYSNIFMALQCGDTQTFLKATKDNMDKMVAWQKERGGEDKVAQTLENEEVAGKPGLRMETDITKSVGNNNPLGADFFDAFVGEGGVMK